MGMNMNELTQLEANCIRAGVRHTFEDGKISIILTDGTLVGPFYSAKGAEAVVTLVEKYEGSQKEAFERGRKAGYEAHTSGIRDEAFAQGRKDGQETGHHRGFEEGYRRGFEVGKQAVLSSAKKVFDKIDPKIPEE